MITISNRIIKNIISITLITALILTGLFSSPNKSYAITTYQKVTKYHLDIGAQHIWGTADSNGDITWQNGNAKGGSIDASTTITLSEDASNVKVYPLTSANFKWNTQNYSFNGTDYLSDQASYNKYYAPYTSKNIYNISYSSSGKNVSFSYTASLVSTTDFKLKEELNKGQFQYIIDLLGGTDAVKKYYPSVYSRLEEGATNGVADNVYGYMYFVPLVIQYDVIEAVEVPIGDFIPGLDVPSSAKQGESFPVIDTTAFDKEEQFAESTLAYNVDGGSSVNVNDWDGTVLGSTINQSFDQVCTVTYTLTVWNIYGVSKSVSKSVNIIDSKVVDGKAILELPEYTYEGHPALAQDHSTFKVDGVNYSATRAYEEGIADNDFDPNSSYGSVSRLTDTKANITYTKKGTYNVTLYVNPINCDTLTDIKPIEVRKTPYIMDGLGGFQKENRKQILTAAVATYPGKPIVDYSIRLKDMKTGQEITLTKDNPQVNNTTIKTRTVTTSGDSYWTNFELLFLTKNTTVQQYQYTIYMKDSKGDTDTVQKTFTVNPDLPPNPAIVMQDSFIRNKGTNIAEITTEDASTTDGDQLDRTWSVEGKNVKAMDGYKDLAFGTGQKVQFNKIGVGKTNVILFLKDVWIEPTLEEYVTDADHKTATTTKTTDVINIAPTVRLEPINTKETDIVIVTDKKNKTLIGASLNTLKAALIENGFDPHISLAVAADADEGPYREVANWTYNTTVNCGICNNNTGVMDSDYFYRLTSPGKVVTGYQEICVTDQPHVLQALSAGTTANSGYIAWSYAVNESRSFKIYLDNKEKYVYISCFDTNKTTILNRDNGAYLTTLNVAIPGSPLIGDDAQNIYFIDSVKIQKYDTSSGTLSTVINRGGSLTQMMDGKITFVGKKETGVKQNKNGVGFYIGKFDINSETIREIAIPDLPNTTGVVSPIDLDSTGKVLFKQGSNLWVADTLSNTVKMTTQAGIGDHMNSTVYVKNEKGEGVYIANAYNNSDYKSNSYFYFALYDFSGSSIQCVSSYGRSFYGYNYNGLSYAKLHSKENKIYILQGSNFEGLTGQGTPPGNYLRISLPSMAIDTSMSNWGWDIAEETGMYNGSLMATYYKLERWNNQSDRIQLFRNSITEKEAKTLALRQNAPMGSGDSDKYVIVAGDNAASQILQDQVFKNEIDLRGARTLVYNVEDGITTIAQQIKELGDSLKNYLLLEGDNFNNLASIKHDIQLLPNTDYEYEYTMTTTGKAIDLFGVKNPNSQGLANDNKYFEKVAAFVNFNSGLSEPFFKMSGGGTNLSWFTGYGSYTDYSADGSFATTFTMEKDGYISFDLNMGWGSYKSGTNSLTYTVDGLTVGSDATGGYSTINGSPRIIYLTKGTHTISFYEDVTNNYTFASINNLKAVYYEDTADAFVPATVSASQNGKEQTISNSFRVDGQEGMEVTKEISNIMTTKTGIEYKKYISSSSWYECEWWSSSLGHYYWETYTGGPFSLNEATSTFSYEGPYQNAYPTFNITAPADKFLIYSYSLGFSGGRNNKDTSQPGEKLYSGTEVRILRPGQTQSLSATLHYYNKGAYENRAAKMYISNLKIAEFNAVDFGGVANLQTMYANVKGKSIKGIGGINSLLFTINETTGSVNAKQITNISDTSASLNNGIQLSTSESSEKISALVSNFSLYKKVGGIKQLIFAQNFNSKNALDLTGWHSTVLGDGKAKIVSANPPIKEEEQPLVYKKGQLVAYNIFYDDYENDPSQKQFWRYTHTPYNDGAHPQAAFILDEDGNVISSTGAILSESIPRFYVDGKYTAEHWQMDNTNRTGDTSGKTDYSKYNKLSNVESLTFYIEGGASAPWITSIKTIPGTVKEGSQYRLQIGVDDAEKDELRLTTEVYKDKKLIYTHKQTGIIADANGNYPLTTTGYPPLAVAGKYDVVCTVRDWSGAGIGSYKFTVVSEGKITGYVNHTDQWNANRMKYNLAKSGDPDQPRGYKVFWSGEKFILRSEVAGNPTLVTSQILGYPSYATTMHSTGSKNAANEAIYAGEIWDKSMINKWGRKTPVTLTCRFTAYYSGGITKTHDVSVIVDSREDYYKLHRYF